MHSARVSLRCSDSIDHPSRPREHAATPLSPKTVSPTRHPHSHPPLTLDALPARATPYRIAATEAHLDLFFYSFSRFFFSLLSFKSRPARLHRESRPRGASSGAFTHRRRNSGDIFPTTLYLHTPFSLDPRRPGNARERSADPRCKARLAQAVSHTTSIKDFQSVKHIL